MIVKITNAANKVLRYLITAILLALVVMLFAQIIGRTCFKVGVPWLEELAKILFVCSMFLGICVGVKEASHIKIDVLTNWLESKGKTAMYIIHAISWLGELVFFGYLGVYGYQYAIVNMNKYTSMLRIRQGLIYLIIPISCVISIIFVISNIYEKTKAMKGEAK